MKTIYKRQWPVGLCFDWDYTVLVIGLLLIFGMMPYSAVYAQSDAYSIEVAVADRSVEEQQDAYKAAFRRVLLNNSGDKTLLNRDAVRAGLNDAERFVASFSYRTPAPGTIISRDTPITERVRQTGEATQLMLVSFDRNLVRQLIDTSARSTSTSDNRENQRRTNRSLVWLLIQDAGRDIMISDNAAVNVQSRAREIAGAAGISLVYPVGDLADQQALLPEDLITQNIERIQLASARYEQGTVLSGNLDRNSARGWRGQWLLLQNGETELATFETTSLDEALQEGLGLLGSGTGLDDSYSYGGEATSGTEGLVWIDSITSLDDYASMIEFLENIPTIATVYPKEINNTSMVFAVLPRSALRDIELAAVSELRLRPSIVPATQLQNSLSSEADLAFVLTR